MAELIGRRAEMARVDALLDHLHERGGALVVRGEPGIGKSALLGRARERAGALGMQTLATVGVESEGEFGFAGVHQMLSPISGRIASLPDPRRRALETAFGVTGELDPDPFRVALAAYQLVCEAADSGPLVLIVDDAHWLDRGSLGVLTFIARRLENEPVAFLAAVRDGYGTPLEEARLPMLQLDRLSASAAAELLARNAPGLSGVVRARVLASAAGNPLALGELARTLALEANWRERLSPTPTTLTPRLERAFAARLEELPEESRLALLATALDSAASLDEIVASVARMHAGPVAVPVLDEAAKLGLVDVDATGVRFRHTLVRSAVRQAAPPAQVLSCYRALAEVVTDPERRLWHRAMAAVGYDEAVAAALEEHARAARRRGAVMVAAAALERAAALTSDGRRRGERLVRAAELAYDLGDVDIVRRLLQQAEPLEVGGLEAARLAWLQQMVAGDVWFVAGAAKTFVGIAERMRAAGDGDMALRSLIPIALRCWWTRPHTRTRQYVVDVARRVDVAEDDPRLLAVIALAHPEETGPDVRGRVARTRLHEVADPTAAMHIGAAAGAAGDWGMGAPFLARAVDGLRAHGRLGMLTQALVYHGFAAIFSGDWEAAASAGSEAAYLAHDTRQRQFGLTGELIAALATALRGIDADVGAMLAKSERTLRGMKSGPMLAPAHLARGVTALGEGRHDAAFGHLWPIFDERDPAFHRFIRWWAVLDLAEAGRGEHGEQVAAVIAALEAIAQRSEPPILRAGLACARPLMAVDAEAEALFAAALAQDLTAHPFLRARTLLSYGVWLRRQRRAADSRGPLRDATQLFEMLGATRWDRRARQELRATGEKIGRRSPNARDRLTAQELQIARLAAGGLSNREIGERLFLSHRTIGSHLYRIFPKLEITTRAQLRGALEREAVV